MIGAGWPAGTLGVEVVEVRQDRLDEDLHLGLDDVERDVLEPAVPLLALRERVRAVVGHDDRPHVRPDRPPDVHRLDDRPVDARDRDDHAVLATAARGMTASGSIASCAAEARYCRWMNSIIRDEDRDEDHDEVRAGEELLVDDDREDDRRDDARRSR